MKRGRQKILEHVFAVAKAEGLRHTYRLNYSSGGPAIRVRDPDPITCGWSVVHSNAYAHAAGVSVGAGLRHLRSLAAAGLLTEQRRMFGRGPVRFVLLRADAERIGRECIAELRAQGLPFDDERKAARERAA